MCHTISIFSPKTKLIFTTITQHVDITIFDVQRRFIDDVLRRFGNVIFEHLSLRRRPRPRSLRPRWGSLSEAFCRPPAARCRVFPPKRHRWSPIWPKLFSIEKWSVKMLWERAVVVVLWSAYLLSTPTIRVRFPMWSTILLYNWCSKRTKINKKRPGLAH